MAYRDPGDPAVLGIMLRSGSTCPYYPTEYSFTPGGALTITVEADYSGGEPYEDGYLCSADDAQMTSTISLPAHVEIPAEITVNDADGSVPDTTIPVRNDFP